MRRLADITFSINKVKVEQKFSLSQFTFLSRLLFYLHHNSSFDQLGPGGLLLKSAKLFPRDPAPEVIRVLNIVTRLSSSQFVLLSNMCV